MHLIHFHFTKREIIEQRVNTASAVDITNTLPSGDLPVHSVTALRHYFLFTRINQIRLHSSATGHFQPRVAAVNLTPLKV